MRTFILVLSLFFLVLLNITLSKPIYDAKKSYVFPLTKLNFEGKIAKIRQTTKEITLIQYFKFNGN